MIPKNLQNDGCARFSRSEPTAKGSWKQYAGCRSKLQKRRELREDNIDDFGEGNERAFGDEDAEWQHGVLLIANRYREYRNRVVRGMGRKSGSWAAALQIVSRVC